MFPGASKRFDFDLMDTLYRDECTDPVLDIARPAFALFGRVLSFSTGVALRIEPQTWTLAPGFAHASDDALMRRYPLEFMSDDPYVKQALTLRQPGHVVNWSAHVDLPRLRRSRFGTFMCMVPYYYCLAAVPLVRGFPAAVLSVHRIQGHGDFSAGEQRVFQWFVDHLARSFEQQDLMRETSRVDARAVMVFNGAGDLIAMSDEAEEIVRSMTRSKPLSLPAPGHGDTFWTIGRRCYRVSTFPPGPGSLLRVAAPGKLLPHLQAKGLPAFRLLQPDRGQPVVAVLRNVAPVDDLRGKVARLDLPRVRRRVLESLLDGKARKDIARDIGRSVNTVKKHVGSLYEQFGVHNRVELLSKIARDETACEEDGDGGDDVDDG